jgi:hypothetical protein
MPDLTAFINQHPALAALAASITIAGAVGKGFEWADGGLSQESRSTLSRWLKNVPGNGQMDAWANVFPTLIDRVFGPKPLSWKFFLRSCLASVVAVFLTSSLTFMAYGTKIIPALINWTALQNILFYLFLVIPVNCLPDYCSIIFSRFIVRQMARRPGFLRIASLLVIDSVVTAGGAITAIALVGTVGGHFFSPNVYHHWLLDFIRNYGDDLRTLVERSDEGLFLRIYVLAALFASLWVWLYVTGSLGIRIFHKARVLWVKAASVLSIDDKPMQAIGRVAGLVAGCAYLALASGSWLFHRV